MKYYVFYNADNHVVFSCYADTETEAWNKFRAEFDWLHISIDTLVNRRYYFKITG